ncbi:hypothetical protein V496_02178 [Pseudogymnoascus sp. VKM F-4515 (FW-2607)]|nr:hypothetical protein V496_02178 [Pseudogymnoascus sp. VKM F-4515 (FW-2607)]KFY96792.1 hypothetical protein V498_02490 [Pseudogymnoascus sp. VKM F-4517 (FW-2822)]
MAAPVAMMDVAPEASSPIHSKETLPLSDLASEAQLSDDDSEGGVMIKPRARGRLAARMLDSMDADEQEATTMSDIDVDEEKDMEEAKAQRRRRFLGITSSGEDDAAAESEAENDDSSSDAGDQGMTARERMLKSMMTEKKKPAQEEQTTNHEDASDDEDIVVPSRSNHRIRQHSSPKPSPARSLASRRGGLFVSPSPSPNKSRSPPPADSDSEDLPETESLTSTARFKALVDRKRQERIEKDAADLARRKAVAEQQALLEDDDLVGSDDDGGKRLTQQVRPTRKASKKAVEEIHRESQRMARNMQLAHQAKTKKKITKSSLFKKFNYKPAGFVEEPAPSSSPQQSDAEMHETPPSSPPTPSVTAHKSAPIADVSAAPLPQDTLSGDEVALPSMEDLISSHVASSPSTRRPSKGKGKAIQRSPSPTMAAPDIQQAASGPKAPKFSVDVTFDGDSGSDDDLEIIPSKPQLAWKYRSKKDLDSIFDRTPVNKARESNGLHALRMLAHLSSPPKNLKKNVKPSISNSELQASLQLRARQQATREREERLQGLRDRGIIVQTAEERAQELEDVEDMITKARREGEEIAKGEKAAAKKNRKDNGEVDPLDMDDSDDEEWQEEIETFSQQLSPSGSEDEADDEEEEASGDEDEGMEDAAPVDMDEATMANALVDDEASESEDEEEEVEGDGEVSGLINDEDEEDAPKAVARRRTKNTNIISDDEDDVSVPQSPAMAPVNTPGPKATATTSPAAPMSVLRSATKTFIPGITVAGPAGLGLTQIFAGTMDTQPDFDATPMESPSQRLDSQQDSLAFLRNLPPPEFPGFTPTMDDDSQGIVKSSQVQIDQVAATQPTQADTQGIQLNFSQSQVHGFDSFVEQTPSKHSEFPEPTQDEGFKFMSPIMGRYTEPPQSTVDTVVIGGTPAPEQTQDIVMESPVVKRKGKLQRRVQAPVLSDDEEVEPVEDFEITDVFDAMRKASKKPKEAAIDFDKKKSAAKEMVEDQASESEDEYAGLGGASDEDSEGEDEAVQAMIDDEQRENFDESKLAAFYADRERVADEQQVNKLFKDITSGMLRKKRGADYDLSDSDDDGEARRRMKRREFAKMRKALLEDEQIGKIAENPKRAAFLRAIEDRGEDEDMIFLDDEIVDAENAASSQPAANDEDSQDATVVPKSQPEAAPSALKRKATTEPQARPPPNLRRTKALASKRPTSLSEIRASVSSLIDDPNAMHATVEDSDSDIEIEGTESAESGKGKENQDPFAQRRSGSAVVDRMSLKRQSSTEMSSATRLAFAASSATAGFKVPPLLRRATTNSSAASSTGSFGGGIAGDSKAAPKKGKGVAFFTREEERTKDIREGERKRQERLLKGVEGRRKVIGGLFGRGKFA